MRYIKLTLEYIKSRHFRAPALICILPAIALAFLKSFSTTASFFVHFKEESGGSFAEIFRLSARFGPISILRGAASILLISVVSAYLVGILIRHMRTGRQDLTKVFSRINENFLSVFWLVLVGAILIILFGLLNSTFVFLWSKVAKSATWLVALLSWLTMAGLFFVLIAAFSYMTLWVPVMAITGQPIRASLSTSIRETKNHGFFSFFWAIVLPLIPAFAIEYLTSFARIAALTVLGDFVFYYILLCYDPVLTVSAYFDVFGLDREDLVRANRM